MRCYGYGSLDKFIILKLPVVLRARWSSHKHKCLILLSKTFHSVASSSC